MSVESTNMPTIGWSDDRFNGWLDWHWWSITVPGTPLREYSARLSCALLFYRL